MRQILKLFTVLFLILLIHTVKLLINGKSKFAYKALLGQCTMPPQLSYLKMTFLYLIQNFTGVAKSKYLICLFHYIGYAFYHICLFPCMPFSIYAFSHICLFPSLPHLVLRYLGWNSERGTITIDPGFIMHLSLY